jgi:hypothetical protein
MFSETSCVTSATWLIILEDIHRCYRREIVRDSVLRRYLSSVYDEANQQWFHCNITVKCCHPEDGDDIFSKMSCLIRATRCNSPKDIRQQPAYWTRSIHSLCEYKCALCLKWTPLNVSNLCSFWIAMRSKAQTEDDEILKRIFLAAPWGILRIMGHMLWKETVIMLSEGRRPSTWEVCQALLFQASIILVNKLLDSSIFLFTFSKLVPVGYYFYFHFCQLLFYFCIDNEDG